MNHAQKFIEQMKNNQDKNNPDLYENIVIRVDQKYAAMLTVLGSLLKFPSSTAFTDVLQKHLFDMAVTMDEENFNKLIKDVSEHGSTSWDDVDSTSSTREVGTIDHLIGKVMKEKFCDLYSFQAPTFT